jgi:hypothetical protein
LTPQEEEPKEKLPEDDIIRPTANFGDKPDPK